jgi:hypothetical protein
LTPFGGTPIARHIVVDPGVQFKAVEGDALATDRNGDEMRAHLAIEAISVHA